MDELYQTCTPTWTTILPACHHLRQLILSTPALWGRIYCMPPKNIFRWFELAAWSPTEIHACGYEDEEEIEAALDRVRSACKLRRGGIHTLEFKSNSSVWPHFSWIFDEPLPNLKHLSIRAKVDLDFTIPLIDAIGKQLESLSVQGVDVHATSYHFYNLRNLHIDDSPTLTMDRLITILESSPRLETLSLGDWMSCDDAQPRGVVTLSHLSSLRLKVPVWRAASILDHLVSPVIDNLILAPAGELSDVRPLFQKDILANRLLKATPNFPHIDSSNTVRMGGFQWEGCLDSEWAEIFLEMCRMVPLSVTEFEMTRDTLDEEHWRGFARRRPEVRSIVSSYECKNFGRSSGLWRALLPDHRDRPTALFPNLESVTLKAEHLSMIPSVALRCLRMRSEAGFKLKRLEVQDTCDKIRHVGRQPEDFKSLADVFVYCEAPTKL